jgi:SAM-dependent methyltransferase
MLIIHPPPVPEPLQPPAVRARKVMLADGRWLSLGGLSAAQLHKLQWEQEQRFARAILQCPKGSKERVLVIGQAYDTICMILAARQEGREPLTMDVDPRYQQFVVELLNRQVRNGIGQPRLFEIGYGAGIVLKEVSDHGYRVSGIEVSFAMRNQALSLLGERFAEQLLLGDLRELGKESVPERPTLAYWNDVFQHISPEEITEYLEKIYQLLIPGGSLVTITPHWLLRPSGVTGDFCPPRTEPRGLHFKEYRLAEVSRLLKRAGFHRVATPLFVTRTRIHLASGGLRRTKQLCEMLLDELPVRYAHLLCRGLGMSITIATK